jgi:hypothetical protein
MTRLVQMLGTWWGQMEQAGVVPGQLIGDTKAVLEGVMQTEATMYRASHPDTSPVSPLIEAMLQLMESSSSTGAVVRFARQVLARAPVDSFDHIVWQRLLALLYSSNPNVREQAAWALGREDGRRTLWQMPGAVPQLLQLLKHGQDGEGGAADQALIWLQTQYHDQRLPARVTLQEVLSVPGWVDTHVEVIGMEDAMKAPFKARHFFNAHTLANLPQEEQEALLLRLTALLSSSNPEQQLGAARALRNLVGGQESAALIVDTPCVLPGMVRLLRSTSAARQKAAVRALLDLTAQGPSSRDRIANEPGLVVGLAAVLSSSTLDYGNR